MISIQLNFSYLMTLLLELLMNFKGFLLLSESII